MSADKRNWDEAVATSRTAVDDICNAMMQLHEAMEVLKDLQHRAEAKLESLQEKESVTEKETERMDAFSEIVDLELDIDNLETEYQNLESLVESMEGIDFPERF